MTVRSSLVGSYVAFQKWRAADANALPGGWLGYALRTSDAATGVTTEEDLVGLTVTVTVLGSRLLCIHGFVPSIGSSVNDDIAGLRIQENGAVIAETRVDAGGLVSASGGGSGGVVAIVRDGLSAGSYTFKLTGLRKYGTGTFDFKAASGIPAMIYVEDVGPAS